MIFPSRAGVKGLWEGRDGTMGRRGRGQEGRGQERDGKETGQDMVRLYGEWFSIEKGRKGR